ncbi:DUF3515 domain-containing protein [Amycolatopsis albispora]|uniref:DUF3515 domain-containing protein n=1 Tax=Amycolatopsis albispora TaxID=1804986 RepID=A0A344L8R3_9PSEU|nr:DUF3515 domain-containing protein [Amycolatopsis albispora]AXB44437.1 hypothetical protein A4R43_19525 [Amycolatopsis albispora]
MPEFDSETGAPPRLLIVIAATLAVALAAGVAVFGILTGSADEQAAPRDDGPLPLVPVPAPQAAAPECATLLGALPGALTSNGEQLAKRELAQPAPPSTTAWGTGDPIILRCGLDQPRELTRTAQLRVVNSVQWLPVTAEGTTTWFLADRAVYVALTVPDSAGTGPLQEISDAIAGALPPVPLRFSDG